MATFINAASKPRVMLDTSVLLSGTVWPRWPYEILQHGIHGDYQLVLAPLLIDEAEAKFQQRFPSHLARFQETLRSMDFELVANPPREEILTNRNLMVDIKDIPIALAAINGHVDYFVSEDKHFTAHTEQNASLQTQLNIMLSGTFLRVVMGWSSDELEVVRGRNWSDVE
ncbi:MAG: PIN domain-containing protein [Caldilineaceae bacterium]|nr:PIN domain-containing protein [Caldilineaceae bacterium]